MLLEWLARVYRLACAHGYAADPVGRPSWTRLRRSRAGAGTGNGGSGDCGPAAERAWPAPGPARHVAVIGPHIVDVLGRPVETIPPGQGSARLTEIRATAAGTGGRDRGGPGPAGRRVSSFGAVGTDLLADILIAALNAQGVSTAGLVRTAAAQTSATILPIRPNGERPALHVPGATRLLKLSDLDLDGLASFDAVVLGGPDALTGLSADDLSAIVAAARAGGALVLTDVLHPGSERDFARIRGPSAARTGSARTATSCWR